ncbi:MAG: hypothetical protein AAFY60_10090, partial [Myxococcota bacterium]
AGGFVLTTSLDGIDNEFDVASYRLTGSVAHRGEDPRNLAGQPFVESFGVYPDVVIRPTVADVLNGHLGVGQQLLELSQNPQPIVAAADQERRDALEQ